MFGRVKKVNDWNQGLMSSGRGVLVLCSGLIKGNPHDPYLGLRKDWVPFEVTSPSEGSVHRLYTRNSDRLYTRDRIVSARGPFLPRIVCTRSAYCYAQARVLIRW